MRFNSLRIFFPGCLLVAFFLISLSNCAPKSLMTNGGFEIGRFDGWQVETCNQGFVGITDEHSHSGKKALKLAAIDKADDIRVMQEISVEPDCYYRFSGYIKAEGVEKTSVGGNLSIANCFDHSGNVCGDTGWKYIKMYFKTGRDVHKIVLAARLGMFCNIVRGTCYFDDLKVVKIKFTPKEYFMVEPGL
ncbi:MAG: carbohydrate binding domain-containing protein [Bacillota bacterium]